jgi:hypothetical protein
LCIQKTDVTPVKLAGFSNLMTQFEDCDLYKNNVITSHYMNPEVLYDYWQKLKSCNISISPEEVYREIEFTPLFENPANFTGVTSVFWMHKEL